MIVLFSLLIHLLLPHFFEKMTFGQRLNNWFAYIFFLIYIVAPLLTLAILLINFNSLKDRQFYHKFYTLYEDLDTDNKWPLLTFRAQFYLRRVLLVIAILLTDHVCYQLMILFAQVFIQIFVIGSLNPYKLKAKRDRELINEFVIVLAVYHVMCFTPVVVDIDTRIYIGYSFIALILTHTLGSLGLLVWSMLRDGIWQLRKSRIIKHALVRERVKRAELANQREKMKKGYVDGRGWYASDALGTLNAGWTRRQTVVLERLE